MMERQVKQVIVIRKDLKMRRGKEIAQGAHASMAWLTDRLWLNRNFEEGGVVSVDAEFTEPEIQWMTGPFTKVVCTVNSEEELLEVFQNAVDADLVTRLITDAGRTEFHGEATLTCVAIGPDWADRVDPVTKNLTLY